MGMNNCDSCVWQPDWHVKTEPGLGWVEGKCKNTLLRQSVPGGDGTITLGVIEPIEVPHATAVLQGQPTFIPIFNCPHHTSKNVVEGMTQCLRGYIETLPYKSVPKEELDDLMADLKKQFDQMPNLISGVTVEVRPGPHESDMIVAITIRRTLEQIERLSRMGDES